MFAPFLQQLSPPRSARGLRRTLIGLGIAAGLGIVALALAAITEYLTGAAILTAALVPLVLAAWFGGYRIGILFFVVIWPILAFVILPPQFTAEFGLADFTRLIFSIITAIVLLFLVERLRREAERTDHLVRELERSNEAKTEFVQHVSHELRTPITIIQGNATILSQKWTQLGVDDRAGALTDIGDAALRLEGITANLLSLARLGAGYEVEREPVILAEVVKGVVERHRKGNPGRTYDVSGVPARSPVVCAPGYLVQVVENLLTNAEKYSPDGSEITVRVDRTPDSVSVAVLDRGKGLRSEEADALFDPFYRGDDVGAVAGLGIGLSVCKRFAEAEGGAMRARPRPGGGAEFTLVLPIEDDGAGPAIPSPAATSRQDGRTSPARGA